MKATREVDYSAIKKLIKRITADAMNKMSSEYFLTLSYKASQFKSLLDEKSFDVVLRFLPNTNNNGRPFILSVAFNKKTKEYQVTVINPRFRIQ